MRELTAFGVVAAILALTTYVTRLFRDVAERKLVKAFGSKRRFRPWPEVADACSKGQGQLVVDNSTLPRRVLVWWIPPRCATLFEAPDVGIERDLEFEEVFSTQAIITDCPTSSRSVAVLTTRFPTVGVIGRRETDTSDE